MFLAADVALRKRSPKAHRRSGGFPQIAHGRADGKEELLLVFLPTLECHGPCGGDTTEPLTSTDSTVQQPDSGQAKSVLGPFPCVWDLFFGLPNSKPSLDLGCCCFLQEVRESE